MSVTAILDYGVGNLFSLTSSLRAIGAQPVVTRDSAALRAADRIILPGVGAFADAAAKLRSSGLCDTLLEQARAGKPLLGICLGMQLLFEKSYEYSVHAGLGLIPGEVVPLSGVIDPALKVPHIGWNRLEQTDVREPLFAALSPDAYVYYVHSFYARTDARYITATSEYGIPVTGAVRSGNVFGTQFHPEKSGKIGLSILKAFCEI